MKRWKVMAGDCVERMRDLKDASVDAVVCDPPYGLEFMGKEWDKLTAVRHANRGTQTEWKRPAWEKSKAPKFRNKAPAFDLSADSSRAMQEWHSAWAVEALRVLKPGGHLLAFGGTRTYHRLVCALEDAGFEIRDCVMWLYGSGFPKSLDVSKAIDKAAGAKPVDLGPSPNWRESKRDREKDGSMEVRGVNAGRLTTPATDDAKRWEGWGTALKPAYEPIVLARKPLEGTVAANTLRYGTGALNIDGCRIATGENLNGGAYAKIGGRTVSPSLHDKTGMNVAGKTTGKPFEQPTGRWPANALLSHALSCRKVGTRHVRSGTAVQRNRDGKVHNEIYGAYRKPSKADATYGTNGREEVEAWACVPDCPVRMLDEQAGKRAPGNHPGKRRGIGFTENGGGVNSGTRGEARSTEIGGASRFFYCPKVSKKERRDGLDEAHKHPTTKPVALMRYLIRLVTAPGGRVLDPFMGSGTTGVAAMREGVRFVGIEREREYRRVAVKRLRHASDRTVRMGRS